MKVPEMDSKINQFVNLIKDESLKRRIKNSIYIAGGSIASHALGQRPRDWDMYLRSMSLARNLRNYFKKIPHQVLSLQKKLLNTETWVFQLNGLETQKT